MPSKPRPVPAAAGGAVITPAETFNARVRAKFGSDVTLLTSDLGNYNLRTMRHGDAESLSIMTHKLVVIDEGYFRELQERHRSNPESLTGTAVFGLYDREKKAWFYYAVGTHAGSHGRTALLTESVKYQYSYWGAIVSSQLLAQMPDGGSNIVMAVGHPTKAFEQRGLIASLTGKTHTIQTIAGETVKYKVTGIYLWDEPIGGLACWTAAPDFPFESDELDDGETIMVIDVGGGITSVTHVVAQHAADGRLKFVPSYAPEHSLSISQGQHSVMEALRVQLRRENQFRDIKEFADATLMRAIRTGKMIVSGDEVDVSGAVARAEATLLNTLAAAYQDRFSNGRQYRAIVLVGGGMASYAERLQNEILNHRAVFTAADLKSIHLANVQGADALFGSWLRAQI